MNNAIRKRIASQGDRERGDVLAVLVVYMLAISIVLFIVLTVATQRTRSITSRDFIWSGQMMNAATADAMYSLNEGDFATTKAGQVINLPSESNPRRGAGEGLARNGTWSWYVKSVGVADSQASRRLVLYATGQHNGKTRTTQSDLYGLEVRSVSSPDGQNIVYTLSPRAAFSHAVFGSDFIKSTINASTQVITGAVGTNGPSSTRRAPTGGTYLYDYARDNADSARCANPISGTAKCGTVHTVPIALGLDTSLAPAFAKFCQNQESVDWVASSEATPRIVANNNTLCVRNLVIDRNTTVIGTGFLHVYVSGSVLVTPGSSFTAASSTPVIYTNSTDVKLQGSTSLNQKLDLFLYAPQATCNLGETIPAGSQSRLEIVGSVACKQVDVLGLYRATWKVFPTASTVTTGSPGTDIVYNRRIWYASNSQETYK